MENKLGFEKELEQLINKYSKERVGGDTPDFILAKYLRECLVMFGNTVKCREEWWGRGNAVLQSESQEVNPHAK